MNTIKNYKYNFCYVPGKIPGHKTDPYVIYLIIFKIEFKKN